MAYQGRKVFNAGEVLTASDLNSTVDQTVMVFADSAARDTAIPTPSEGMIVYLESDNSVLKYDGSNWISIALDTNLTADRVMITNGSGDLAVSDVTTTELGALDGITATSSELNILDGATISTTEINRLDNVSSNIQTQLNNKQADVITTRGDLVVGNSSGNPARLGRGSNGQYLSSNGTDLVWDDVSAGGMTLIASGTVSNSTLNITSIPQTFNAIILELTGTSSRAELRANGRTSGYYKVNVNTDDSSPDRVLADGFWRLTTFGTANAVIRFDQYTQNIKQVAQYYANDNSSVYTGAISQQSFTQAISSLQTPFNMSFTYKLWGVS